MKKFILLLGASTLLAVLSCGPRQFVKGQYDKNVEDPNLLTDKWSESDMQKAVKELVASAMSHPAIADAKRPPVLMVTRLQNKTDEHIDTQSITDMFQLHLKHVGDTQSITDMFQVELMRSGKVTFVDKAAREDISAEYDYQDSGMVERESKKGKGGQVGADFIMNGRLDSIVQEAGKDKTIYYKLTMNLTNLKTGLIQWTDHQQIRKEFKKRRIGF